jgi:type VI protein secretion system component VasF
MAKAKAPHDVVIHQSTHLIDCIPEAERVRIHAEKTDQTHPPALWLLPEPQNVFIMASNPLMSLIERIESFDDQTDQIRKAIESEWTAFCTLLAHQNYHQEVLMTARFVMGLWLHDALAKTTLSNWTDCLPKTMHSKNFANKTPFFDIAHCALAQPKRYMPLIEWMHFFFKQGFMKNSCQNHAQETQRQTLIEMMHEIVHRKLPEQAKDEVVLLLEHLTQRHNQYRYYTWITLLSMLIIFLLYASTHAWMVYQLKITLSHLQHILAVYDV